MQQALTSAGGRHHFPVGSKIRIQLVDGRVSEELFEIAPDEREYTTDGNQARADRKGLVAITELDKHGNPTDHTIKVAQRRVLPADSGEKALVNETGDRYWAICPKCAYGDDFDPSQTTFNCPTHGTLELQWLGVKPMLDAATKTPTKRRPAKEHRQPADKAARQPKKKEVPERIKVDFAELKKHGELWTKKNVSFDHPNVHVQAHCLLILDNGTPRKLCFNTYDGSLGKKASALPLEAFIKGDPADGKINGKTAWFVIKDVEKAKTKLHKDLFTKHH